MQADPLHLSFLYFSTLFINIQHSFAIVRRFCDVSHSISQSLGTSALHTGIAQTNTLLQSVWKETSLHLCTDPHRRSRWCVYFAHLACPWLGLTNRPPPPTASTFSLSNTEFLRQIRLDHLESPGQATPQQESASALAFYPFCSRSACPRLKHSWHYQVCLAFFVFVFKTAHYLNSPAGGWRNNRKTLVHRKGIKRSMQDEVI